MIDFEPVGELQIRVLHVLWSLGEPTPVQTVLELVKPSSQRVYAYTTILTVMRTLRKRGFLTQTKAGRAHVFEPTLSFNEYSQKLMDWVCQYQFGGDIVTFQTAVTRYKKGGFRS